MKSMTSIDISILEFILLCLLIMACHRGRTKARRGIHGQQWTPSAIFLPMLIVRWVWYSLNHPTSKEVLHHQCQQGHMHYHGHHHHCSMMD
ncbi:hypothetical protein ACHAWO_012429 [Cyclotella atomus]|uniref:Secreted protein n=1 Tax=Cyclotella atomus TaxID=382360 RepID=A0ABD3N0U4_9STRA